MKSLTKLYLVLRDPRTGESPEPDHSDNIDWYREDWGTRNLNKVDSCEVNWKDSHLHELDLSNVSFANSDITKIRFSEAVKWNEECKGHELTVYDEKWFVKELGERKKEEKKKTEKRTSKKFKAPKLGSVISVYRSLRENYEFRLRYDIAGKLFINEMELKRKYTDSPSYIFRFKAKLFKFKANANSNKKSTKNGNNQLSQIKYEARETNVFERYLSLTAFYYYFSKYGESILRPTIIGAITVGLSTLFWLTQADPDKEFSFSKFVGAYYIANLNISQLEKAFERSLADFLPLLSSPNGINIGVIDYIIKIVGGLLTFGLLVIALRRKFERKYTR